MRSILGLMLGMGLLSAVSAQTQTCSKQTITGTYGLLCTVVGGTVPSAIIGVLTGGQNRGVNADFIGSGKQNISGSVQPVTLSGTSIINSDCSGTMSLATGGGFPPTLTLIIHALDGGNEIRGMTTDPIGVVFTCSLRLISR